MTHDDDDDGVGDGRMREYNRGEARRRMAPAPFPKILPNCNKQHAPLFDRVNLMLIVRVMMMMARGVQPIDHRNFHEKIKKRGGSFIRQRGGQWRGVCARHLATYSSFAAMKRLNAVRKTFDHFV